MKNIIVFCFLALGLAAGCGGIKAPTMPNGQKIALMVVADRGIEPEFNEGQVSRRNQVGEWMETDLMNMLEKQGYAATLVSDPSQAQPGPGRYVLNVKITNYNPGSKAARMFGGIAGGIAGKCVLDTHYELVGEGGVMVTDDLSISSTNDWDKTARKANKLTTEAVTNRFRQSLT